MATRFYSSVEYSSRGASNDADCIYYNANIVNNSVEDTVGDEPDPQVVFSEARQNPIIRNPSDFMMSVVQFSSIGATQNLPVWIPRIQVSERVAQFIGTLSPSVGGFANLTVTAMNSGVITNGLSLIGPSINLPANTLVGGSSLGPPYTGTGGVGLYKVAITSAFTYQNVLLTQVLEQNDVDLTVYSVVVATMSGTNVVSASAPVYLRWQPRNLYSPAPAAPVTTQNVSTDYYYAYEYSVLADMANVALATAAASQGLVAPTLAYNSVTGLFTLTQTSPNIGVFFNTSLETILPNFPGFYTNNTGGQSFLVSPTGAAISQSYSGVSAWSPVMGISVTSNLLPIGLEQCATPSLVGASSVDRLGQISGGTFLPIVWDTAAPTSSFGTDAPGAWRQAVFSEPQSEYRMISLTATDSPIQSIDFQVWWRNRLDSTLYPLRLVNGSSVSIKVLFRRKQMGV